MQSKIEWLEEQGWEPVHKQARKPWRFRVVTGGKVRGCRSPQATGCELMGLLNRIGLEDCVRDSAVRTNLRNAV